MKKLKLNLAESGKEMLSKEQMKQVTGGYDHSFVECISTGPPWFVIGTYNIDSCSNYNSQTAQDTCNRLYGYTFTTDCQA